MNAELCRKYRAEVERLDGEIAHYDQLWTQVPYFALAAALAPVAAYLWGWPAAFVELFVSAALVGVRAYLIAMRKSEIVWNRARLLEELGERADWRVC
jgi:hypothetical protein